MGDNTTVSDDEEFINNIANNLITFYTSWKTQLSKQFAKVVNSVMTKPFSLLLVKKN